jgi:hypothetical protein
VILRGDEELRRGGILKEGLDLSVALVTAIGEECPDPLR